MVGVYRLSICLGGPGSVTVVGNDAPVAVSDGRGMATEISNISASMIALSPGGTLQSSFQSGFRTSLKTSLGCKPDGTAFSSEGSKAWVIGEFGCCWKYPSGK
jgi:hypothetical protein